MNKPAPIVQRRLAAIFSADVAGYTRLMNSDEAGTLRLLGSHREVTDRLIAQQGGRIANTAGDSILAEFPSAVDALHCALGIQERIGAVNDEVPEERRLSFRIGIHVGEAMVRSGDLFGDAVNVAARMQGLAEPGSVCVSGAAYEYVRTAVPLDFEDIGAQRVKNLEVPIRAYLARPSGQPLSRALPPVHRRVEAHLARRFHALCHAAMIEVTGPEDVEPVEFAAIASLHDAPGIDHDQLAERMGMDLATARRIVKRLEHRGFVARSPKAGGGRSPVFSATPAGGEILQRLRPAIRAAQDRVMAPLSDREREILIDLLARVIKARDVKAGSSDQ
ncbi:MAG TPA: adenylate/guanylate cyclase domain-containing protein [Candidatus Angelobacter sp.]|nr:adenylate/guanylate cyclase domain-containing protein [Candidatus Angelobacter sp.]